MTSVYMKIFLNHFQIMEAIAKIKFGWPGLIQLILNLQQNITSLTAELISFDCILIDYFTGPDP